VTPPFDDLDVAAYDTPRGVACAGCRKLTDAAVTFKHPDGRTIALCGTHADEYQREEPYMARWSEAARYDNAVAFAKRLREGKYRACWVAEPL